MSEELNKAAQYVKENYGYEYQYAGCGDDEVAYQQYDEDYVISAKKLAFDYLAMHDDQPVTVEWVEATYPDHGSAIDPSDNNKKRLFFGLSDKSGLCLWNDSLGQWILTVDAVFGNEEAGYHHLAIIKDRGHLVRLLRELGIEGGKCSDKP